MGSSFRGAIVEFDVMEAYASGIRRNTEEELLLEAIGSQYHGDDHPSYTRWKDTGHYSYSYKESELRHRKMTGKFSGLCPAIGAGESGGSCCIGCRLCGAHQTGERVVALISSRGEGHVMISTVTCCLKACEWQCLYDCPLWDLSYLLVLSFAVAPS